MTPTEKHREMADDVYDNLARGHNLDGISRHDIVLAFAFAIAKAEREGMKRAAEIAREQANIDWEDGDGGQYGHGYETACGDIAAEILSEAGEGLSYSQSGLSYAGEKGRGFVAKLTDEQMAAALAYDGEDSPVGELTDNQKSEPCLGHATEHSAYVGTAPDGNPTQDDVGATASSTNSNPQPTKGESDAKSAHDDSVYEKLLTIGAGPVSGAAFAAAKETGNRPQFTTERQPSPDLQNAPAESAADTISAPHSHSQAPLTPAMKTGEAPSSSQASPATLSDMPISTTPSFAGRVTGDMPDIPDFLRRTERKAREWEEA